MTSKKNSRGINKTQLNIEKDILYCRGRPIVKNMYIIKKIHCEHGMEKLFIFDRLSSS